MLAQKVARSTNALADSGAELQSLRRPCSLRGTVDNGTVKIVTLLCIAVFAAMLPAPRLLACSPSSQKANVAAYLMEARDKLAKGELIDARRAVEAALERDEYNLDGIELASAIALAQGDKDASAWFLRRFIDVAERDKATTARGRRARPKLIDLDPGAREFDALTEKYLRDLLAIAKEHEKKGRMHSALALYQRAQSIDPLDPRPGEGLRRVRKTGGADVAVADVYAGGDPTLGKSAEWIREQDTKHSEWKQAWTDESENYRYRTNAGYRVLKTASIAMENVNRFYRRFFRHKEDGGKIAKIEIRIFKNRDEYLELGRSPAEWSGGHFIGDAVETFVGGVTGKDSIRQMYGVLFHEAAHHFVSMTSPRCPGWLNEAFASFFEGCEILSNGSVRWNRVPGHRLFPLAARLEKGWMATPTEGIAADGTGRPEKAPRLRMIVEQQYRWGPPWYGPTWGLVYFLHNYRNEDGRLLYRDALQDFYASFKGKRPQDVAAHFEEVVLGVKGSPVTKIDALDDVWKQWLLDLRDYQRGKSSRLQSLVTLADRRLAKKDEEGALEILEDAYLADPDDPEVLWRLASLAEKRKDLDRAAALYRDLAHLLEQLGLADADPRHELAKEKSTRLDPLVRRYKRLEQETAKAGLALARDYYARGFPLMALTIAKRMTAQVSVPEALDLYREIARKTGKTLARWRLAYNERSLEGWSSEANGHYEAYGNEIRVHVKPTDRKMKVGEFLTSALTADVVFESDFSLEAEVWIEKGEVELAGLCFGRKDANDFHAILLHPKGYLDVAASRGASWDVLDHRQVPLSKGWHKLRIDVAGKNLDFYFDGLWVRTYAFPNEAVLRGAFGLITGEGKTRYRRIRLMTRDPFDPSARIERELAMEKIRADASLRTGHSFAGFPAPELETARWVIGDRIRLAEPGVPTLLFFWTERQERAMPTLALAKKIAEDRGPVGLRVVLVAGDRIAPSALKKAIGEVPAGMLAVVDERGTIFREYGIKRGGYGLPRAVLIDVDTHVIFEGDLGVKGGTGWQPGGATYLDDPLARLVESRKLAELKRAAPQLADARKLLRDGKLDEALTVLRPLAALPAARHPVVAEAKRILTSQLAAAKIHVERAAVLAVDYPVRTARRLEAIEKAFVKDKQLAKSAKAARAAVRRTKPWKTANLAILAIEKATELRAEGRDGAAAKQIEKARKRASVLEVREAIERYERAGADK